MDHLERAYGIVNNRLPEEHVAITEKYGLFEREGRGWAIRCYNRRACLFVVYDKGIAKCSIQDAYAKGEIDWPKPQSCHLFPLRIRGKGNEVLEFETFSECRSALIAGKKENVSLIEFLTEPITRVFGSEFHGKMMKAGENLMSVGEKFAGRSEGEESSQC